MSTCDASATRYRIRCRRPRACTPSVESLYDGTRRAVENFNAPLRLFTRYWLARGHGHAHRTAIQAGAPLDLLRCQSTSRIAAEESAECDLDLHAPERRTEAEVNASPEGEMLLVGSQDVEAIGIRETLGIAVRRVQQARDRGALRQPSVADHGLAPGEPHRADQRTVVAQRLFDRLADQRRIADEQVPLIAVPEQRHDGVSDEVARRGVAGIGEKHDAFGDLLGGQPV